MKNGPKNNGRVGQWGISYPGFYASAGLLSRHPALKAVSPQAPIADWFWDDFHHNGAFFLPHAFNFLASFGLPRPQPTAAKNPVQARHARWLRLLPAPGPAEKRQRPTTSKARSASGTTSPQHPNYDAFWQARNLRPHLKTSKPPCSSWAASTTPRTCSAP